jgi:protein-S-isoprenylcysteine O-methyltransferase Ste14
MKINVKQQAAETIGFFVMFALALFLPAGTLVWTAGWIFLLLFFGFYLAVTFWLYRHNPGLMQERMRLSAYDQQGWDKILFPIMEIFFIVWLIFISLDAVRFHWSPIPFWLQAIGAVILLCSFYFLFLTFRENSYLSPVVRVQEDRGHKVASTGLYHFVRHPMYMAILVFIVGTSLLLGSWYGSVFVVICMCVLARRAVLEEQMLLKELPGYADYTMQVKYRFIPYVW